MNTVDTRKTKTRAGETAAAADALALYVRDVESHRRLSPTEEKEAVTEIVECRQDIVSTIRALVVDAADALAVDPVVAQRLHDELADPTSEKKLEALALRLQSVVETAVRAREILHGRVGSVPADGVDRARRLLSELARGFGVPPAILERVTAEIAEKRRRIAAAKQKLVEANLRLVLYFARRMKWRGVDTVDLVQEGNVALLRAADAYDPTRGFTFGSFACTAIRRAMSRFGSAASRPVHVPSEVRARRQRVRQVERHLTRHDGPPPSWDEIAEYLGVSHAVVVDALGDCEEAVPLDATSEDSMPILGRLADETAPDAAEVVEVAQADRQVRESVAALDPRDRRILEARFDLDETGVTTLAEVGRTFGVTRERARQLESRALRQLRTRGTGRRRQAKRRHHHPPSGTKEPPF